MLVKFVSLPIRVYKRLCKSANEHDQQELIPHYQSWSHINQSVKHSKTSMTNSKSFKRRASWREGQTRSWYAIILPSWQSHTFFNCFFRDRQQVSKLLYLACPWTETRYLLHCVLSWHFFCFKQNTRQQDVENEAKIEPVPVLMPTQPLPVLIPTPSSLTSDLLGENHIGSTIQPAATAQIVQLQHKVVGAVHYEHTNTNTFTVVQLKGSEQARVDQKSGFRPEGIHPSSLAAQPSHMPFQSINLPSSISPSATLGPKFQI